MIAKQYKLAGQFIRERVGKIWLLLILVFLAVFLTAGVIIGHRDAETIQNMISGFGLMEGDGFHATWYNYLWHNGQSNLLSALLGLIPFIPVTIAIMLYNALTWGAMAGVGAALMGKSVLRCIAFSMLPHCIFELPANCLSEALGLLIFITVTGKIRKKTKEPLKPLLINCLRVYVLIVLPLLLVAGIVEAEITPLISAMI